MIKVDEIKEKMEKIGRARDELTKQPIDEDIRFRYGYLAGFFDSLYWILTIHEVDEEK